MKLKPFRTAALFLAILTIFGGCASPSGGAANGHEQEFRRQLADCTPMRDYGYVIKELRFSPDYRKALVVFVHTDAKTRPDWEFVLKADDFGRYRDTQMQPFYTPGTGHTPPISVTVTLPAR